MALLHHAQLTPSKTELLAGWVSARPWFVGDQTGELASVAAFRFDDPEGEVGVETLLVRSGDGPVMQVPLTYRGAPLDGSDTALIGTLEHSVLGKRWVYDGAGDPVYLLATAVAALNGGRQADMYYEVDGTREGKDSTAFVTGSGSNDRSLALPEMRSISAHDEETVTVVSTPEVTLVIRRQIDRRMPERPSKVSREVVAEGTLTGTWAGVSEPQPLVLALAH